MNPVERVLYDEITRLLDRIAASVPDTSFAAIRAANPTLRARLDEAEATLAAQRAALLEGYGRWRRALEDVENLWALAAWRSAATEEPAEQASALAAGGERGLHAERAAAGLEALPVVGQFPRERDLDGDEPRGLVRRGAAGGLHARGLRGRQAPSDAGLEVGEERAHARLVLRAIARVAGLERGQPPRAPA